jgi:hypothetical protein
MQDQIMESKKGSAYLGNNAVSMLNQPDPKAIYVNHSDCNPLNRVEYYGSNLSLYLK